MTQYVTNCSESSTTTLIYIIQYDDQLSTVRIPHPPSRADFRLIPSLPLHPLPLSISAGTHHEFERGYRDHRSTTQDILNNKGLLLDISAAIFARQLRRCLSRLLIRRPPYGLPSVSNGFNLNGRMTASTLLCGSFYVATKSSAHSHHCDTVLIVCLLRLS